MPRLVDADELRERFLERAKRAEDDSMPMTAAEMMLVARDIDRAPTIGGWISVKDRLPEYTGWYLTYHHKINLCVVSWFTGDGWEDGDWGAYEDGWVSHWMPLPEDPKEASGNA